MLERRRLRDALHGWDQDKGSMGGDKDGERLVAGDDDDSVFLHLLRTSQFPQLVYPITALVKMRLIDLTDWMTAGSSTQHQASQRP
ncbi:hypothetical protein U9M48_010583 [Paspalum notatum var. saurae]|uniref:Uncharacterized protein n=1 Tax=Paspalum notatum var. saurae TaxID=547442 RepID=A0AAQ3WGN4_PASNO